MFTQWLRAFEVAVCSWKEDLCHFEQKICSWTEWCVPWCLQVARAQLCWWHMEGGLRAKHSQKRVTQEHRNCQDTLGNTLEHLVGISKHREDGNRGRYHHFHEDLVFLLLFFTVSRQCYNHIDIGYQIHYTGKTCVNQFWRIWENSKHR